MNKNYKYLNRVKILRQVNFCSSKFKTNTKIFSDNCNLKSSLNPKQNQNHYGRGLFLPYRKRQNLLRRVEYLARNLEA